MWWGDAGIWAGQVDASRKPVSSICLWFLLQAPTLVPLRKDCNLYDEIKPIPSPVAFCHGVYYSNKDQTGIDNNFWPSVMISWISFQQKTCLAIKYLTGVHVFQQSPAAGSVWEIPEPFVYWTALWAQEGASTSDPSSLVLDLPKCNKPFHELLSLMNRIPAAMCYIPVY